MISSEQHSLYSLFFCSNSIAEKQGKASEAEFKVQSIFRAQRNFAKGAGLNCASGPFFPNLPSSLQIAGSAEQPSKNVAKALWQPDKQQRRFPLEKTHKKSRL